MILVCIQNNPDDPDHPDDYPVSIGMRQVLATASDGSLLVFDEGKDDTLPLVSP